MARIAMFLARSLGAPMTGRKAVIRTAIRALTEERHRIDLFLLAKPEDCVGFPGAAFWLGTPPKRVVLMNAALALLRRGDSLNEALFRSGELLARAGKRRGEYDFAIADTLRAAPYAAALGVPWHLDLDDLFSARYESYLTSPGALSAELVLGYYRSQAPRLATLLPPALLKPLLRREAARLRQREVYWARKATSVSLVSPDEARTFARLASRPVHSLPMAVPIPARPWCAQAAPRGEAVFLGGLDYKPNLDSLLHYRDRIFPLLKRLLGRPPVLHHLGNAPRPLRERFQPEVVRFEGYVADVGRHLAGAAFFLAPIVSGTGIKTKVLEAMALGLPVLTTPQGVAGLDIEHRRHCFVCERDEDFASGIRELDRPERAERMGLEARRYVQTNFSPEVLRQRWAQVMGALATGRAQGSGYA